MADKKVNELEVLSEMMAAIHQNDMVSRVSMITEAIDGRLPVKPYLMRFDDIKEIHSLIDSYMDKFTEFLDTYEESEKVDYYEYVEMIDSLTNILWHTIQLMLKMGIPPNNAIKTLFDHKCKLFLSKQQVEKVVRDNALLDYDDAKGTINDYLGNLYYLKSSKTGSVVYLDKYAEDKPFYMNFVPEL